MTKIPPPDDNSNSRNFLFLQGHPSRFWSQLSDGLKADGHLVFKVHFCLADLVFWGWRRGKSFRGKFPDWGPWVDRFMSERRITDIIYYADRFPYHKTALKRARARGVNVWVIEFGYLRPDWITFERDGMGAFSNFPRSKVAIQELAQGRDLPDSSNKFSHGFFVEAWNEVVFDLLQFFGRLLYPFYRSDRMYWPWREYFFWLVEFARKGRYRRDVSDLEDRIRHNEMCYNLVAMQLQADYQIRDSSDYSDLGEFLDEVFGSFVNHAAPDRELVIKLHPLDSGAEHWHRRILDMAEMHGVERRVHVIKGGDLAELLTNSNGVVLVNSTVGIRALGLNVPVCVMGSAVFDIEGLNHKGGLDSFWDFPTQIDRRLLEDFLRALSTIQIKGSFYDPAGRRAAISEICNRFRVAGDKLPYSTDLAEIEPQ